MPTFRIGIVPIKETTPGVGVVKVFATAAGAGVVPVQYILGATEKGVVPVETVGAMAVGVVPIVEA